MLKKLELVGFKSFADRTAFEFAAGITAVVGPNGSGKSNVVDAVKWVLGEQSAKSLRGGAMADVIFNGSTTRRPHAQAEVTLTFDNAKGFLATEAAEVRIGRRVFRDGQSDYLINGQLSRLKDVKDLFLGTGAGAYSIIEQGRVDALLQASQDDRRAIFEEAAGVSRYKAKKAECLRRLERVGQNTARLQDILNEVDQQLRTVQQQAAKALKYQEHTTQLRELRLALGLRDYRVFTEQLNAAETALTQLRAQIEASSAQSTGCNERADQLAAALATALMKLREYETIQNESRSRDAVLAGAIAHDSDLVERLKADAFRFQSRQATLAHQVEELAAAASAAATEFAAAEQQVRDETVAGETVVKELRQAGKAIAAARQQVDLAKTDHLENLREAAKWQNESVSVKAQIDQLARERKRLSTRTNKAAENLSSLDVELESLRQAESSLDDRLARTRELIAAERQKRDASQGLISDCHLELIELRATGAGVNSRIDVLESWYRERDGLGAGVKFVMDSLRDSPNPAIVGWLPDLLTTTREDAPLIDLALGTAAQHFIVRDTTALLAWLNCLTTPLPGRVGFIDVTTCMESRTEIDGAVCAATLIHCDCAELVNLPNRLLGDTFIVADLKAARRLNGERPECRFITRAGELLENDGTVVVGEQSAESGVLSRQSELRDLRQHAAVLAERMSDVESEQAGLEDQAATAESAMSAHAQAAAVLAEQHAEMRTRMERHKEKRAGLQNEVADSRTELSGLDADIARDERQWQEYLAKAEAAQTAAQQRQTSQSEIEKSIQQQEQRQQQLQQAHTAAQVSLARVRERADGIRARREQAVRTENERRGDLQANVDQMTAVQARVNECCEAIESAKAELVAVHVRQQATERDAATLNSEIELIRAEQNQLLAEMQAAQAAWQRMRDELHIRELSTNDLRHQRDTLTARMAEDYQIDLAAAVASDMMPEPSEVNTEQAQASIEDLRKKLHRLGSVNLEALDELKAIEVKHHELKTQFDDLSQARKSLEDSIHKINADSKRLFIETFDNVKVHFQDLFRRLFGGGMADIVLEKPDDPLETPIDIVARPPGKELRSIALMSGGERTMTAVALLLAIFRSKPSPFCILDEVDAALDEANTSRLTNVLREFACSSQFIVITHAKRTMAAANVLYGVTMQESGVSKRVAVRFDEWPDEAKNAA